MALVRIEQPFRVPGGFLHSFGDRLLAGKAQHGVVSTTIMVERTTATSTKSVVDVTVYVVERFMA